LLERAEEVFSNGRPEQPSTDVKELHAKIGQLAMENDFLYGALGRMGGSSAKRQQQRASLVNNEPVQGSGHIPIELVLQTD